MEKRMKRNNAGGERGATWTWDKINNLKTMMVQKSICKNRNIVEYAASKTER